MARAWLSHSSQHVRVAGGDATLVDQRVGLDTGCPLCPGLFAVATRRARQRAQEAMRQADPLSRLPAFLGDTYMVCYLAAIELGRSTFDMVMGKLRSAVNTRKENMWRASAAAPPGGRGRCPGGPACGLGGA